MAALLARPAVDHITPNEGEDAALAEAGALDSFHGTVVQTRGAGDVVDTTGAGETFNGYPTARLAAHLAAGDSCRRAVEGASPADARAIEREGAQLSIPTADEVDAEVVDAGVTR